MSKAQRAGKKQLFDEDEDVPQKKGEQLKINEDFAKRFEHNKRRELLDKAVAKYGEKALLDNNEDGSEALSESSSSADEDDDAELLNSKVEKKFLETLTLIRENNPKLKELQGEVFKDSDFEDDGQETKQKSKPVTYKDLIREDVLAKRSVSEDSDEEATKPRRKSSEVFKKASKKETIHEEEQRLKQEFKKAVQDESESSDDEGFIKKKEVEEDEDEAELARIEELRLEEILKKKNKKKEMKLVTDVDLLKRFYGDDSRLDSADKFLRNYILLEGWKDKGGKKNPMAREDEEDEARDEEMDQFEHKYNFRFEEQTGTYLTTHAREVPESMRRKDETRKEKRLEKLDRKQEEKRRKMEELNQLKQMKRDEILEKLKKAEFLAGAAFLEDKRLLEKAEKELKTEFIPDLYDRAMAKVFDDKYYEQEDEDIKKLEKKKTLNLKLLKDQMDVDEENREKREDSEDEEEELDKEAEQQIYEREITKPLKQRAEALEQEGYETWYVCDGCTQPIDGGKFRFDCNQCDNFCFCEKCYRKNKAHLHKFTKTKVPLQQKPPTNHTELIEKAYMLCHSCKDSLLDLSKRVFICKTCSGDFDKGDIVYFCLKCKNAGQHEHKLEKLKGVPGDPTYLMSKEKDKMTEEEKSQYLEGLLDEYYNLDYEDIIGGGQVKTRFKYKKVNANDYGLTEDEILLLDDKQLNRLVSLRKYRPYMDPEEEQTVNMHRVINIKKEYQQELNEKRKLLKQALASNVEQEKDKLLKGKTDEGRKKHKDLSLSKNKLRKEKRQTREGEDDMEEQVEMQLMEDDAAAKKRRRMALYGK